MHLSFASRIISATVLSVLATRVFALEKYIYYNYDSIVTEIDWVIDNLKDTNGTLYNDITKAIGGDTLPSDFDEHKYDALVSAVGGEGSLEKLLTDHGIEVEDWNDIPWCSDDSSSSDGDEEDDNPSDSAHSSLSSKNNNHSKDSELDDDAENSATKAGILGSSFALAAGAALSYFL